MNRTVLIQNWGMGALALLGAAGISAKDFHTAGCTAKVFKDIKRYPRYYGDKTGPLFTAKQLFEAGYTAPELKEAGFPEEEIPTSEKYGRKQKNAKISTGCCLVQ